MKTFFTNCLSFWPGFSGVIKYGLWRQLGYSMLFSTICFVSLFLSFFWSDFLPNIIKWYLLGIVILSWLILNWIASRNLKAYEKIRNTDENGEFFLEAQTNYLRGNWFETECCLKSILRKNPYDVESLLLLATLYRHIKRYRDAKNTLEMLERIEKSSHWQYEITYEKKMLKENESNTEIAEEEENVPLNITEDKP